MQPGTTASQRETAPLRPVGQQPENIIKPDIVNVRGSGATMSEGAIDGQGNILGDDEKVRLYLLDSNNNSLLFKSGYICISLIIFLCQTLYLDSFI